MMTTTCPICGEDGVKLEGHLVRLRPLQGEEDIRFLFGLRNDVEHLYLWTTRREVVSFTEFQDELRHDERLGMLRLIIEKRDTGERIGTVFSYDHNRVDRHCSIVTVLCPTARRRGYGAEATALFLRYLFAYLNLEKVYAQVYEFNLLSRQTLEHGGFKREGVFPRHHFWDGRWWTMYQYAYYADDRDQLKEVLAQFCPLLRRNGFQRGRNHQGAAEPPEVRRDRNGNVQRVADR
jgi:diamine N-acetyltransferase